MSDRRPYCRVYWSIRSDPKFIGIYTVPHRLGTWLQLLIAADAIWPEPADLPRSVSLKDYRALVDCGLLDDLGGGRYRVHGLDAERTDRGASASVGASVRWSERTANGMQTHTERTANGMPSRAEPSRAKPSTPAGAREGSDDDPAGAYWALVGKYPTGKVLTWIDDLTARYGGPAVIRSMAQAHISDPATATLLGRTGDLLAAGARQLERAEREDEERRLREKRAVPAPVMPAWDDAERAALWERHRADIAKAAGRA